MAQGKPARKEPHFYSDRLRLKLDSIRSMPAIIVEAPSGYGKTTAIRDYLDAKLPQSTPVYWFTAADEAPVAGFRRLSREIEKIDSHAGERLLKIELPNAATIGEACEALRTIECRREAYLIIDNFQFLSPSLPPSFFTALIEHGSEGLHIIIITQMLLRNFHTAAAGRGFLHITASDLRLSDADIYRYFYLAGVNISREEAKNVFLYTEGWVIAVYLQLCAFRDTGSFTDTAILTLLEHLVWDALTEDQQIFLMRLSIFEIITVPQACALSGCDTLPGYALDALRSPFIHYDGNAHQYELHSILSGLLARKRSEQSAAFRQECLLRAGDCCQTEHKAAEAFGFYAQAEDYERMLSLDLSYLILEDIGNRRFSEYALQIARNCPAFIKEKHLLSMLQIAWALRLTSKKDEFTGLMEELRAILETGSDTETELLMAEWTLLDSYRVFPDLAAMTEVLKQAQKLFHGTCSRVILPDAPWCFGEINPYRMFHITPGEVHREADALEDYLTIYTKLTNGHGSGGDVLFRAFFAYSSGDLSNAEILAYKAAYLSENNRQGIVLLGSAYLLAELSLHHADLAGWQNAVNSMERAASFAGQNHYVTRAVADIARGLLYTQLGIHEKTSEWLKNGDLTSQNMLPGMLGSALTAHVGVLFRQEEFSKLIGKTQAALSEHMAATPLNVIVGSFFMAVSHMALGQQKETAVLVERAIDTALQDGLVYPVRHIPGSFKGFRIKS